MDSTVASVTIEKALQTVAQNFKDAGIPSARLDARVLLAHILEVPPSSLLPGDQRELSHKQLHLFDGVARRRLSREPVSHILGIREFWGRDFAVSKDVLDPRPDTETLIEAVLNFWPAEQAGRVLDLGTGSGCILLTLLAERPDLMGVGIDQSSGALRMARRNASSLGVLDRADLQRGDWLTGIRETFDIVVSNPPYIPGAEIDELEPEVARFEPRIALDGGRDGMDAYRRILSALPDVLGPDGRAFFEIGMGQHDDFTTIAEANGLSTLAGHNDLAGVQRVMVVEHARQA